MPLDVGGRPMRHTAMTDRKDKPRRPPANKQPRQPDTPFDLWLKRGLHELYDEVAKEPIPAELLRLIEENRKR